MMMVLKFIGLVWGYKLGLFFNFSRYSGIK